MRAYAPLAVAAFLLSFAPGPASAQVPGVAAAAPGDDGPRPYSVAGLLGFGMSPEPDSQGLGVGLRGGVTMPSGMYFGGTAVYHLRGRAQLARRDPDPNVSGDDYQDVIIASAFYLGGEVGMEFEVGPLLMRPYAGLGFHGVRSKTRHLELTGEVTESSSLDPGLYIAPGFVGTYPLFDSLFVGIDARYVITPLDFGARGASLFATLGKTFLGPA